MSPRHPLPGWWLWLSPLLSAQEPPPRPEPTAGELELATQDLERLAARHERAKTLVGRYVQRRTSELVEQPLVTEGELRFRRDPAVIVFVQQKPREVVVRLDDQTYQVWRPQRRRLERFQLDGPDLPRSLFAALQGDLVALRRDYRIAAVASSKDGESRRIELEPRDAAVRARLSGLTLTLACKDGSLRGVAYRDPAGDRIELELVDLRLDPTPVPEFELKIPPGAEVLDHKVPPPAPAPRPKGGN